MHVERIDNMLNFSFEKLAEEIVSKAQLKATSVRIKITEREARIKAARQEYKIDDQALLDIMNQARANNSQMMYSFTSNTKASRKEGFTDETITIGAGVVNMLLTEQDFIEGEKAQVAKLETIARNLKGTHKLSFGELTFLGF